MAPRGKLLADAMAAFKPGAFAAPTASASTHHRLAKGPHFVTERAGSRWRMTVRSTDGEGVVFFDTEAEANRARMVLSDLGFVGLRAGEAR